MSVLLDLDGLHEYNYSDDDNDYDDDVDDTLTTITLSTTAMENCNSTSNLDSALRRPQIWVIKPKSNEII